MNTNNIWKSTELTRYYYKDTDTQIEIDIKEMQPADVPSFWKCLTENGTVILHYVRILMQSKDEQHNSTNSTDTANVS